MRRQDKPKVQNKTEESQVEAPRNDRRLHNLTRLLSLPLLIFLILPIIVLLWNAPPGRVLTNLGAPQVLQAVVLSLSTTLTATVLIILLGTPLAYGLARRHFRWQRLVEALVDLPLVLPPAVAGLALLLTFGRSGLLGGALSVLGISIPFTPAAVIIAQVFIASPFYIRAASIGFAGIDSELEQAAGLDGASRWQIFRHVILPLSWAAVLSGAVLAWARALGEFGATIIFAGNFPGRTQTMPLAIYLGFELNLDIALTLSAVLVGLSFLALIVVRVVLHRDW